MQRGEYSACLVAAERAAELAGANGDEHTRVLADVQRMNVLQTLGRVEDALQVAGQLFPLDEETEDLVTLLRAYRDLSYIHMLRGNLTEARSRMERAFPLVEKLGDPAQFAFTHGLRGWLSLLQGDWALLPRITIGPTEKEGRGDRCGPSALREREVG